MRLVAGFALIVPAVINLRTGPPIGAVLHYVLAIAAGLLLLVGLWTPIAGLLSLALALWNWLSLSREPWADILIATLGTALVLLGPGAWSVDARLFGWKRIDIRDRERSRE